MSIRICRGRHWPMSQQNHQSQLLLPILVTRPPATSTPGATGEKKKNSHPLAALQMLCDNMRKNL